jgi:hypothetical protein
VRFKETRTEAPGCASCPGDISSDVLSDDYVAEVWKIPVYDDVKLGSLKNSK